MAEANLTAARLRELVSYNCETGAFFRLIALKGGKVGTVDLVASKNGYVYLSVDGKKYLAHRLAWLWVRGVWPVNDTDHINCIRTDNRFANLRDVERHVNNQNRAGTRSDNKSSGMSRFSSGWISSTAPRTIWPNSPRNEPTRPMSNTSWTWRPAGTWKTNSTRKTSMRCARSTSPRRLKFTRNISMNW